MGRKGPVHATLEKFEISVFNLKTCQMFSRSRYAGEIQNGMISGHFGFVFEGIKTRSGKSHDYRGVIVFEKLRFQDVILPHENVKPVFSNSSGLKSVFEKLRFRDRLVRTIGLTIEIKLRFQISPA